MLSKIEVQRAIAAGAPPVPWKLRTEDREVIDKLATYFAKAIPVPTDEGRVVVKESFGYSGPQLELYVPVLSEKSPVAVMIRSWHSGDDLDADLYFFGAADGRLATILGRLGFKQRGDSDHAPGPVFRQSQVVTHKRAS
ncbi:MAG TPA: hypothetical protein VF042_06055 [Gemmatimonadaceae bacterium]